MRSLEYAGTSANVTIPLEGPDLWAETATGLRGRQWAYTVERHAISGVSRDAYECDLTVKANGLESLDLLRRVCDADVAEGTPGLLIADDWQARAYVVKSSVDEVTPRWVTVKLTVVLVDGVWRRADTTMFRPVSADSTAFLDYPYDYPHDWRGIVSSKILRNPGWTRLPVKIVVYGRAVNPYVIVGSNTYRFDVTVESGGLLVCDGIAKTVTLLDANGGGATNNAFAQAHRGSGVDGGEYCFQPLPGGESTVVWSGDFGFDLTYYEEEGEPPWST